MPKIFSQYFISVDGQRLTSLAYAFLFLWALACFAPGISSLPPIDRDEPLFAQASKQMIESHNYLDIKFQDKPRYKKPIGIYWLQAASVKLFNPEHLNEIWAYRIPSFLGAALSVLMTAALGALLFNPMTGFLAGIMMAGCLVLNAEARLAKTDAVMLATILMTQYGLAAAYLNTIKNGRVSFTFWSALGIGFLIKGPVILLVQASTLLWLFYKDKSIAWFSRLKPRWGIPYTLLLIAPWFVVINFASHGAFLAQSAGHDMLAKIWQSQEQGVILPPGLYLLAFPATFFPFSLFALLALPDIWANRHDRAVAFCLGWIIPFWILFECLLTKLPHYTMPVYPAIAILSAKFLCDGFPRLATGTYRGWIVGSLSSWLVIGTTLALATSLLPDIFDQTWSVLALAAAAFLISAQTISLLFLFARSYRIALAIIALDSLIFVAMTCSQTLPNIQHLWISRDIVRMAESIKPCPKLHLISAPYGEPSLVFLAGTNTTLYQAGEHAAASLQSDPCAVAVLDNSRLGAFLSMAGTEYFPKPAGGLRSYSIGNAFWRDMSFYTVPPERRQRESKP